MEGREYAITYSSRSGSVNSAMWSWRAVSTAYRSTGSCSPLCCPARANCPLNIRFTSSSSSASLLGKTWKNELCPMPAAFAISPVVVFV